MINQPPMQTSLAPLTPRQDGFAVGLRIMSNVLALSVSLETSLLEDSETGVKHFEVPWEQWIEGLREVLFYADCSMEE